ncbi:nuclear pore membrane glycoprotein 210 [Rhagoletis pomonella]|uniref:nuclear pore membrane glycoprotein 210 n=1 Tax=Rhagoletis pomonella TaxID=28610 RepID=UPI00177B8B39|nr:nuclear pore membrane glycoprotein 210 [Rhagoletis pomonella]
MACKNCLVILSLFALCSISVALKLNYPRVLLPIFNKISVNFTLEVIEKGCFKWSSSRQDLILVTPLYEDVESECSYRATVTVLTREAHHNAAIVLAEDVTTGENLRCDVILDVIDKLGVHTTTRQLFLEEAPETFELRAEDSQGNEFTTLEGIEFSWVISSLSSRGGNKNWAPALRFLTFNESPYHVVPPALEKFEAQRLKGYMVLLEGINTGTAKVTISIPYPEYSHVPKIEVFINVLANIILEPSDVHLLPGDTINFRILQLKMGKLQEISLNDQYFLEIEDSKVASISGNSANALKLGKTVVVLRDRNAPFDEENSHLDSALVKASTPSARVTVAEPVRLGLSLLPHNNWITVEGEKHEIALDLYTRDDHKITLGSRFSMQSELDEVLFYILSKNKNGSRIYGEAMREGVSPVYGYFKELTAQAELQIFSELLLSPNKVILPFDPNVVKTQKIQFHARGGDGSFTWHSQNQRSLHISQTGLVSTVIRHSESKRSQGDIFEEGAILTTHATIRVALTKNPKITRQADIYFLPPNKLEIIKHNFETALKDYVRLHVAIYAYVNETLVPFTRCENLVFDYEFSNQIFQVDYNEPTTQMQNNACQVVHLRSTAVGLTNLRISYKFQDKVLKDEVTLSVFEPLLVLNPTENEVILPIGSSRNIIYANGPQKMFTLESDLTKSLAYDGAIAEISESAVGSQEPMHVFNVMCRKIGKTTFTFNIHNALLTSNFQPYISTVSTTVHCVKPRFLNLYATEQLRSSCPMEVKNSLLHIKERDDKFEIEIEVQDSKNRKLMNITSLFIDWEFTAGDERYQNDAIMHFRRTEEEIFEGVRLPSRDVLITTIADVAQNFRIKGVVTRYDGTVLKKHDIYAEEPNFGVKNPKTGEVHTPVIENEIRFMAVNSTLFPSDHVSIFLAKNRRERIQISQGSGFYEFELYEQNVVSVEYDAKEKELVITPLRVGHVSEFILSVCIESSGYLRCVPDLSPMVLGTLENMRVTWTTNQQDVVDIYNVFADSGVEYDSLDLTSVRIKALNPGKVKIQATVELSTGQKISNSVEVVVFKILELESPKHITMDWILVAPRSTIQLKANLDDVVYKLDSDSSGIVKVSTDGVVRTQDTLGRDLIINPGNGKEVVISADTVEVHVVPFVNIQVKTPLVRIRSGAVMPAAVWGVPDLSPMVLGTLENMRVTWTTNQQDVVDIYNVFADSGVEYDSLDLTSVRIKALNPGKVKIQATVELSTGQKITNSVEVVVFKILELESPKHITMDWILVAPRSTIQLKANLDDVAYKLDSDSSGIVKVSTDGVVRTQDTLGRDLIIAKTFEQSLPIGIEVKNIQYILTSLAYPTSRLKQTEAKIPRGMNFVLKISLHDNLGNEFSHNIDDVNGLKYDLSRKDIVDVQIGNNLTIGINLPREANNMIAISLRDTTGVKYAEDYIKLSVAESPNTFPTKTIFSVGDIICFDSPLTLSSVWSSSDEQIIAIDKFTGVAQVLGNRLKLGEKIVVTNGDKASGSSIKYDVEVRDADVIQLLKSFDIFSGSTYRGHLVVRNHLQVDKFTNLLARNISKCSSALERIPAVKLFKCRLTSKKSLGQQLLEHYVVTPIFEADTGRYACQIELSSDFNEVLSLVKTNDVHFDLEAQLPNGLSDVMSLKFVPGVRVTPETLETTELKEQDLTITGLDKVLQKVEVKASDAKYLQVIQQVKAHGSLQYKVKILHELPTDEQLFVHVHSPTTQQDIEIPILGANTLLQTCSTQPFSDSSSFFVKVISNIGLIVTALVVLAFTVWLYVFLSPQQSKTEINADGDVATTLLELERTSILLVSAYMPYDSEHPPQSTVQNFEVFFVAYADYSAIALMEKFPQTLCELLQRTLRGVSKLSTRCGLSVSSSKMDLVFFTRSYKRTSTTLFKRFRFFIAGQRTSPISPSGLSSGIDTQVYGDSILMSPQQRVNRRYL